CDLLRDTGGFFQCPAFSAGHRRRRHSSIDNFAEATKALTSFNIENLSHFFVHYKKKSNSTVKRKKLPLSLLIPLELVCSRQKQDSTAEQQLTQQKTELDARDKALDEREKALEQREKLVAKPRVPRCPE